MSRRPLSMPRSSCKASCRATPAGSNTIPVQSPCSTNTSSRKSSQFGIIEMTRQRIRPSLKRSVYQDCPHCHGTGQVKTCESMSIDVMRMLQLAAHRENVLRIEARVHEDVANYLLNKKRKEIARLEEAGNLQVIITAAVGVSPETLEFVYYNNNNTAHKFTPYDENRLRRR